MLQDIGNASICIACVTENMLLFEFHEKQPFNIPVHYAQHYMHIQ